MEAYNEIRPMSFKITDSNEAVASNSISESIEEYREENERKFLKRGEKIGRFFLFSTALFSLILIGILADSIIFASQLFEASQIFGYLYLAVLSLVLYFVFYFIYLEVSKFLQMKKVDSLRKIAEDGKDMVSFANGVLALYGTRNEQYIINGVANFQTQFPNIAQSEFVPVLEKNLFSQMDREAEKVIFRYAKENALATAISPVALFDFIFLFWRNTRMVNEIVEIYGVRAGLLGNITILRRVMEQLIFIGVAEVTEESVTVLTGQTIASKLSSSVAQGVGHGILTVRIGVATMRVSRPVKAENSGGMISRFLKSFSPFKKGDK
jgi:putative membrane protein